MARIELVDPAAMSTDERTQYERFPANLMRALLRTQGCAEPFMSMGFALRKTRIDARRYELAILRVAALSGCRYMRMQHLPPARRSGWSEAEIEAIEQGRGEALEPADRALLAFVEECVTRVRVSDRTFAEARRHFDEGALADATMLVGFYMMTARFLETLAVDLDDEPCDVLLKHARHEWAGEAVGSGA